ncbi:MAG TPA: GNAT family N-acetyltransferase [Usitatibacter sp.]|nr:GNAT family N-acetyltransferase [Usitatibacter sp.]
MAALRFVSAGAAQGLVGAVAREAGAAVEGSFGAVGAMLEKLRAGPACDVVILTHAQVAALTGEGAVIPGTAADLGVVATSIAVRTADPAPRVEDPESLRAALLAADAIYFPDPAKATAGIHFAKVLDSLAIRDAVAPRVRNFPNGATSMREMAGAHGRPIGCTQATEILATPGVKLVAPLPRGLALDTVYTAAVDARAANASAARHFVARLTGAISLAARSNAGFRGYAIRPATAEDAVPIRHLVRSVLDEYGLAPDPSGIDRDLEDPVASYAGRGGQLDAVIDESGRLVGCCGVMRHGDGSCELRKMYLAQDARGRGLGKRLLERALAFARGRGFPRIELETAAVLATAIAMYEAAGFRALERPPCASRCDRTYALDLA